MLGVMKYEIASVITKSFEKLVKLSAQVRNPSLKSTIRHKLILRTLLTLVALKIIYLFCKLGEEVSLLLRFIPDTSYAHIHC